MQEPPIPDDEEKRLALLRACRIIYTPQEEAFDEVARLAASLCSTEIALITLVDADYQWFKARVGIEQTGVSRDLSFCGHCITGRNALVVEDTHLDARFADNPLVTGDPGIRFYAGVPLEVEDGSAIGALSVADRSPRRLTPMQLESLRCLARQISRELRLRRDLDHVKSLTPIDTLVEPGTIVGGRWLVHHELGRGGVGAVFSAEDSNGQRVALKVLLPAWRSNEQVVERFAREARVLMRLKTSHVGKLIDVGNLGPEQGDLPFLVLEYLEGTDLDAVIENEGPVDFRQAFAWCKDACAAVGEAHELGVIHRDIKPSNVFLADVGSTAPLIKVLDFGLAAGEPSSHGNVKLTKMDAVLGSPAYMSPEQMVASGEVDARADIWSMGALLYELLTSKLPFEGETDLQMFSAAMTHTPKPLSEHLPAPPPPDVEAIVFRCLEKQPANRFDSMSELRRALDAASAP
jgi:serine/threonine-protein kinase